MKKFVFAALAVTAIIWGTGLTPVDGDEAAKPLPGDHKEVPVEVYVGLKKADISYRGRSGCCVGVDQIFFKVPTGITGCHVPVAVNPVGKDRQELLLVRQRAEAAQPLLLLTVAARPVAAAL